MNVLKRVSVTILIVGIALLVAGIVMGGEPMFDLNKASVYRGGTTVNREKIEMDASTTTEGAVISDEFTSADIKLGGVRADIKTGDSFAIDAQNAECKWYIEDGALYVKVGDDAIASTKGETITITLPKTLDAISLSVGAGSVDVSDISCKDINVEIGAGKMSLKNIDVTENADLEIGMGALECTGSMLGNVDIECGMGSVNATLKRPEDLGYKVSVGMGHTSFDGIGYSGLAHDVTENSSATTFYKVDCALGNVDVKFN